MRNDLESRIYAKADIYQALISMQSKHVVPSHRRPSQILHALKGKDLYGTLYAGDVKSLLDELCQEIISGSDKTLVEKVTFTWGTRLESVYRANKIEAHPYSDQEIKDRVIRQLTFLTADDISKAYSKDKLVSLICASTYYQVQPGQVVSALTGLVRDEKVRTMVVDGSIFTYQLIRN